MKTIAYACILTLALTACASQPEKTLSEKLEGKTPQERQEILRLECLNEAEYSTDINKARHQRRHSMTRYHTSFPETEETKRLKTLCREMTKTMRKD